MKSKIILEINSKKKTLGYVEIPTPSTYILCNNTEAVKNNRIFDDFMDDIFGLTVNELQNDYSEKIDNVYVTFFGNNDVSVCSFVLDKLKPKKSTYRLKTIDWQSMGRGFKYIKKEDEV